MIVDVRLLPLPLASGVLQVGVGHEVVHLHITLLYVLLLQVHFFAVFLGFWVLLRLLLVGILVVHAVVEVLVVELLVVAIKLAHSGVESHHDVLVFHQAFCCGEDLISGFVARLRVERAQDDTATRVVLEKAVFMRLDAALREFCVEIVGLPRGLDDHLRIAGSELLLPLLFEVAQFLFLDDVGELFADQLQLLLVEDVDGLRVLISKPWVREDVMGRGAQLGRLLQHRPHQGDRICAHGVLVLDLLVELLDSAEVADLVGLEGHIPVEHRIQADARRPNVDREALVPHVLHDFRSDVRWCSALLEQQLILFSPSTHAEVTDLDVSVAVEQDVIKFDVSVGNSVVVQVGDALHDLLEHKPGVLLAELPTLSHVVEQVAAWTQLHNDHMMLIGLERLQDFDVVGVSQRLEDVDFVHDLLLLRLLLHEVHVDALDGHELPGQPVEAEIDFSEGTFAQHLTDLVEFQLRLWWLLVLVEAVHDELADQEHFLRPRRQLARIALLDLLEDVELIRVGSADCFGQIRNV